MKKIGFFLGVLFMGLLIFVRSPAPARADAWVLPFSKVNDIIEMAQTLFSGGKLDFTSIISSATSLDDIIDMWQEFKDKLAYSQTQERANTTLHSLVELTQQGFSVIDSSTDFYIPFTYNDVGAFTLYNPYWYLYNIANDNDIVESPDFNYISYINKLNNKDSTIPSDFWFYNVPQEYTHVANANVKYHLFNYPVDLYSYCVADPSYNIPSTYANQPFLRPCYILDIDIVSYNGSYSIYEVINTLEYSGEILSRGISQGSQKGVQFNSYNGNYYDFGNNAAWSNTLTFSFNGTLEQCLNYCTQKFKNVNLYVDGVLWSYVGTVVGSPVLAPDVVGVGDTGIDNYDVYGLELPDDLGLDIPNFIEWILTKLREGATTISLDDAIADEVPLVKTVDGDRAITYEDTRPIWEVIVKDVDVPADDPDDPDPSPSPTPDPDNPPILKLPTLNYLPHNHETTVLSELIDATQQTVPEELMNLIWNCFGLLVVGGLIYILHK